MPPVRFRAEGQHRAFELQHADVSGHHFDVTVQALPALTVYGLPHRGSYMAIGRAFDLLCSRASRLAAWRGQACACSVCSMTTPI